MTTLAYAGTSRRPLMGPAVRGLFAGLRRHWLAALVLAALFVAAPNAALTWLQGALPSKGGSVLPLVWGYGSQLLALLFESGVYGGLGYAFGRDVVGQPATLAATLLTAVRRAGPIAAARLAVLVPLVGVPTAVLFAVALAARGNIAPTSPWTVLVVALVAMIPGLVLLSAWGLAPMFIAAEGRGVIAALRRSWRTSRGARGRILALVLLYTAVVVILALVAGASSSIVANAVGRYSARATLALFGELVSAPAAILAAAGWAAVWRALADPPPETVAAAFE